MNLIRQVRMGKKDVTNETVLFTDRLGDEKKIQAILIEWGIDKPAIGRMIKEHRERQASAPQMDKELAAKVNPGAGSRVSHARLMSPDSHSR
jgi:hypothetical protein